MQIQICADIFFKHLQTIRTAQKEILPQFLPFSNALRQLPSPHHRRQRRYCFRLFTTQLRNFQQIEMIWQGSMRRSQQLHGQISAGSFVHCASRQRLGNEHFPVIHSAYMDAGTLHYDIGHKASVLLFDCFQFCVSFEAPVNARCRTVSAAKPLRYSQLAVPGLPVPVWKQNQSRSRQ